MFGEYSTWRADCCSFDFRVMLEVIAGQEISARANAWALSFGRVAAVADRSRLAPRDVIPTWREPCLAKHRGGLNRHRGLPDTIAQSANIPAVRIRPDLDGRRETA